MEEGHVTYDVSTIRADFPILDRRVGERPLVYLDSANTSQKPRQVVDAVSEHYLQHNANVARAMHRNRHGPPVLDHDVVTTIHPVQHPSSGLEPGDDVSAIHGKRYIFFDSFTQARK